MMLGANLKNCDLILPTVEFAYNSSVNRSIDMSLFEVAYGYKPRKTIDLICVMHRPRTFESASAFTLHVHDLHKKKVMRIINPTLICTAYILNLMRVIL